MADLVRLHVHQPRGRSGGSGVGTLLAGVAAILALSVMAGGIVAGIAWGSVHLLTSLAD
jgi:hypothetical protein